MERDYEIFERLPDASVRCLGRVQVLEARGKQTTNECFAMNTRTREIIARVNVASRAHLLKHLTQNR
jgi:hypothetical protein